MEGRPPYPVGVKEQLTLAQSRAAAPPLMEYQTLGSPQTMALASASPINRLLGKMPLRKPMTASNPYSSTTWSQQQQSYSKKTSQSRNLRHILRTANPSNRLLKSNTSEKFIELKEKEMENIITSNPLVLNVHV